MSGRRKRAGVLQSRRGRHQDDDKRPVNTAASSRGGDVSAGRRMTEKRGGGAPTTFLGNTGHEDANERHLRVPHRAAELLTTSKAADRRRTGRTEAAAGTRVASAGRTGALRRLGLWRGKAAQRGGAFIASGAPGQVGQGPRTEACGASSGRSARGRVLPPYDCDSRLAMTGGARPSATASG
jgi:hypothetical protein